MTSLTDVYDGSAGRVASRRQRLVGTGLFLCGVAALVGAVAAATTGLGAAFGRIAVRELAGVLAGLGVTAVLLGAFAVQPADRRLRGAAVIGAGVAALGVSLFVAVYPDSWVSAAPATALATMAVYVAGAGTTFVCLFLALATFDPRAAPGGTARMTVTEEGRIRLVEDVDGSTGPGGVGLFGEEPTGDVDTQTNRDGEGSGAVGGTAARAGIDDGSTGPDGPGRSDRTGDPNRGRRGDGPTVGPGAAADGGGTAATDAASGRVGPDEYCGNCTRFDYVLVDGEMAPYCAHHDEVMADMDACEEWTPTE